MRFCSIGSPAPSHRVSRDRRGRTFRPCRFGPWSRARCPLTRRLLAVNRGCDEGVAAPVAFSCVTCQKGSILQPTLPGWGSVPQLPKSSNPVSRPEPQASWTWRFHWRQCQSEIEHWPGLRSKRQVRQRRREKRLVSWSAITDLLKYERQERAKLRFHSISSSHGFGISREDCPGEWDQSVTHAARLQNATH
jgi:hypothetical protein